MLHRALFSTARTARTLPYARHVPLIVGTTAVTIGLGTYFFIPSPSRAAPTSSTLPLSTSHFTPITVQSNEVSGPSTKILTLALDPSLLPPAEDRVVHSIYIKDNDIQVERPYTPLYGLDEGTIRLWIKRYDHGEVGRWLHGKRVGERLDIRGTVPTWDYGKDLDSNQWDEIILISGGTGITPFFQFLHSRFNLKDAPRSSHSTDGSLIQKNPHVTLLHSSPSPSTLPPSIILSPLSSLAKSNPLSFSFRLFVDGVVEENPELNYPVSAHRITQTDIEDVLRERGILHPPSHTPWYAFWHRNAESSTQPKTKEEGEKLSRVLVLICGPEPMINAIAGPRARNLTDGPVGGALKTIGFGASQVRKLS